MKLHHDHAVAAWSFMQLQYAHGGPMKMGSSSGYHAATEWSIMQLQHDQVLVIYPPKSPLLWLWHVCQAF